MGLSEAIQGVSKVRQGQGQPLCGGRGFLAPGLVPPLFSSNPLPEGKALQVRVSQQGLKSWRCNLNEEQGAPGPVP